MRRSRAGEGDRLLPAAAAAGEGAAAPAPAAFADGSARLASSRSSAWCWSSRRCCRDWAACGTAGRHGQREDGARTVGVLSKYAQQCTLGGAQRHRLRTSPTHLVALDQSVRRQSCLWCCHRLWHRALDDRAVCRPDDTHAGCAGGVRHLCRLQRRLRTQLAVRAAHQAHQHPRLFAVGGRTLRLYL